MSLPLLLHNLVHWEGYGPEMEAISLPFHKGPTIYFSLSPKRLATFYLSGVEGRKELCPLVLCLQANLPILGLTHLEVLKGKLNLIRPFFTYFRSSPTSNQSPLYFTALGFVVSHKFIPPSIGILDICLFWLLTLRSLSRTWACMCPTGSLYLGHQVVYPLYSSELLWLWLRVCGLSLTASLCSVSLCIGSTLQTSLPHVSGKMAILTSV